MASWVTITLDTQGPELVLTAPQIFYVVEEADLEAGVSSSEVVDQSPGTWRFYLEDSQNVDYDLVTTFAPDGLGATGVLAAPIGAATGWGRLVAIFRDEAWNLASQERLVYLAVRSLVDLEMVAREFALWLRDR